MIRRPPRSTLFPYPPLSRSVPPKLGPFAVLAEPTPAWISVPSLLIFTALTLLLAGLHIRRQEISYADRKSTRLNSSHANISYAVFCLKKKNKPHIQSILYNI